MGSTQGRWGSWWKCSQRHFQSFVSSLVNLGDPGWLEVSKCDAHLQGGPEEGSGELQPCQPDLGARERHRVDCLEWHIQGKQGIGPRQDGFGKGSCYLTYLIFLYDKVTYLVDEERLWILSAWTFVKLLTLGKWLSPCIWSWWAVPQILCSVLSLSQQERHFDAGLWSEKDSRAGLEHRYCEEQLKDLRLFNLEKRGLSKDTHTLKLPKRRLWWGVGQPLLPSDRMEGNGLRLFWLDVKKNFVLKLLSSTGTCCPGEWLSHYPCNYLKAMEIWHLGT